MPRHTLTLIAFAGFTAAAIAQTTPPTPPAPSTPPATTPPASTPPASGPASAPAAPTTTPPAPPAQQPAPVDPNDSSKYVPDANPNQKLESTAIIIVAPAPAGAIKTADDLLTALENAGKDLRSLQADLRQTRRFSEIDGGGEQVNEGRLIFVVEPAAPAADSSAAPAASARRKFQVDFTTTIIDNARRTEQKTYIFDGEWFIERVPAERQIFKRQVVPPGQTIDPLAIGEGPFPLPIGQKKARILERFDANLLPAGDGFKGGVAPESLKSTYQLQLIPKKGVSEARQFREVRIWYRPEDLLPRMARTMDQDDSSTEIFLTAITRNEPPPAGSFDASVPAGWDADVTNYRRGKADE